MRKRSYTGAVVSAIGVIVYYAVVLGLFFWLPGLSRWIRLLLCLVPLAVWAMVVFALVQRIRELRSGETDDLDQY